MRRTIAAVELPNGVRMPYIEQGDPAARTVLLVHVVGSPCGSPSTTPSASSASCSSACRSG